MIKSISLALSIFISPLFSPAFAAGFDCSVIYDEFDSLMHNKFLVSPNKYVSTVRDEISFDNFNSRQKNLFTLRKDRPGFGIGIVYTNYKLYGKFLFDWPEPDQLTITDIIIYNRISDGYGPYLRGPVSLSNGSKVDLDSATHFKLDESKEYDNDEDNDQSSEDSNLIAADLELSNGRLRGINSARVHFPTATLCR